MSVETHTPQSASDDIAFVLKVCEQIPAQELPNQSDRLAVATVLLLDRLNPYANDQRIERDHWGTEVIHYWSVPGTSLELQRGDIGDPQSFSVYAVMVIDQESGLSVKRLLSTDLDNVENNLSADHLATLLAALETLAPGYGELLQSHFPPLSEYQSTSTLPEPESPLDGADRLAALDAVAEFKDQMLDAIVSLEVLQGSDRGFDDLTETEQQVLHEALYTQFVSLTGLDVNGPFTCQTATYEGESYTVLVESEDNVMNSMTCTVKDSQGAVVFEACDVAYSDTNPNCGFHVFQCSLDNATILQVAHAYRSEPDTSKTGIDSVPPAVQVKLADLVPAVEGLPQLVVALSRFGTLVGNDCLEDSNNGLEDEAGGIITQRHYAYEVPGTELTVEAITYTSEQEVVQDATYEVLDSTGQVLLRLETSGLATGTGESRVVSNQLQPDQVAALRSGLQALEPSLRDLVPAAIDYLQTLQVSGEGFDALLDGHQQVLHEALYTQFVSLAGVDVNSPPAGRKSTYQGESYTVYLEESDDTRLCTLCDAEGAKVFQAYDGLFTDNNPNSGFGVVECSLDNATILEVAQAYLSEPDRSETGIDRVASEVKRLGDFAPAGSKALVVAESVLRIQSAAEQTGELYTFARTAAGGLSVSSLATQGEVVSMAPDGTVGHAGLTDTDKSLFQAMYSKLQQVAARSQQTTAPTVKTKADLER